MSTYKSEYNTINCSIYTVYEKLSDPQVFKTQIERNKDRLPEEARENIEKVHFEADGISIESPMGPVKLSVSDSVPPSRVVFSTVNSPMNFNMAVDLEAIDDDHTRSQAVIDIELPFFLKAVIGNQLAEAATKLGEMLAVLPYNDL